MPRASQFTNWISVQLIFVALILIGVQASFGEPSGTPNYTSTKNGIKVIYWSATDQKKTPFVRIMAPMDGSDNLNYQQIDHGYLRNPVPNHNIHRNSGHVPLLNFEALVIGDRVLLLGHSQKVFYLQHPELFESSQSENYKTTVEYITPSDRRTYIVISDSYHGDHILTIRIRTTISKNELTFDFVDRLQDDINVANWHEDWLEALNKGTFKNGRSVDIHFAHMKNQNEENDFFHLTGVSTNGATWSRVKTISLHPDQTDYLREMSREFGESQTATLLLPAPPSSPSDGVIINFPGRAPRHDQRKTATSSRDPSTVLSQVPPSVAKGAGELKYRLVTIKPLPDYFLVAAANGLIAIVREASEATKTLHALLRDNGDMTYYFLDPLKSQEAASTLFDGFVVERVLYPSSHLIEKNGQITQANLDRLVATLNQLELGNYNRTAHMPEIEFDGNDVIVKSHLLPPVRLPLTLSSSVSRRIDKCDELFKDL